MSRLVVTFGAVATAVVFNAAALFVVVKAANALPARAAPVGLVATPREIVEDHVRLGDEDDVVAKDSPVTTSAPARRVAVPPPPTPPSALVEDALRARVARQLETLPLCRRSDGPEGRGLAEIKLAPDGKANVALAPPFAQTAAGACVARRLAGAAQPFDGAGDVTIRVSFEL